MWKEIMDKFSGHPAQREVVRLLLERGFRINSQGRVVSGGIEIPHSQIAREVGVDRRIVDATAQKILKDEMLRKIFQNIRSTPLLIDIAPLLNLGVIVIEPKNAEDRGILGDVATTIAKHGLSIRQAVSDDPYFTEDPKLKIVTDGPVSGELIDALKRIPSVRGVRIY
ncbi:MAG: amino acid-binding protein [Candidatus Syntropharchaeia archaeon]